MSEFNLSEKIINIKGVSVLDIKRDVIRTEDVKEFIRLDGSIIDEIESFIPDESGYWNGEDGESPRKRLMNKRIKLSGDKLT